MCDNFFFKVEYFDKDGNIKPDLFSDEAEKVVQCFIKKSANPDFRESRGRRNLIKKISSSQMRKFYDEVLNLKARLENGEDFKTILPYFMMLKAKAHMAFERDVINTNFKTFVEKNVDYVNEPQYIEEKEKRFKIFCTFFEAVVAYAKGTIRD